MPSSRRKPGPSAFVSSFRRKPEPSAFVSSFRRKPEPSAFLHQIAGPQWTMPMHSDKQPCVYILASRRNGTLYIGVTSDLPKRVHEHKCGAVSSFTRRYRIHHLVWFEVHETMHSAISREKAIKEWKRKWKIELIEKSNPYWRDLCDELAT